VHTRQRLSCGIFRRCRVCPKPVLATFLMKFAFDDDCLKKRTHRGLVAGVTATTATTLATVRKMASVFEFPYVCPEPVLAK
jgi:hypothetical protein